MYKGRQKIKKEKNWHNIKASVRDEVHVIASKKFLKKTKRKRSKQLNHNILHNHSTQPLLTGEEKAMNKMRAKASKLIKKVLNMIPASRLIQSGFNCDCCGGFNLHTCGFNK